MEEIVEIRWLTGCQGLIGECGDFELYLVVDRKPVEVTKSLHTYVGPSAQNAPIELCYLFQAYAYAWGILCNF